MNLIIVTVAFLLLLCFAYYLTTEVMGYIQDVDYRLCELEDIVDNMRRRQEDDGK